MPEVFDRLHLGEEAVATDVEAPSVALHRSTDATDDVVCLEDDDGVAALDELIGRGQARGPCADDGNWKIFGAVHA